MQLGFGMNAFESGLLTCASAVGALFMKTLAARILQRFGFRRVLTVNAALVAITLAGIGSFTATTPHLWIIGFLLFTGCLRSLQFTSLNTLSYAEVDKPAMSQATSLASVVQQLAAGTGITVGALALEAATHLQGQGGITAAAFTPAFIFVGLVSASSLFWLWRLPRDAGA